MKAEDVDKVFNLERWAGADTHDRARMLGRLLRTTPAVLTVLDMTFGILYPHSDPDAGLQWEEDWLRLRGLIAGRDENPDWRAQAEPVYIRISGRVQSLVAETAVYPQEDVPLPPTMPANLAQAALLLGAVGEALRFNGFQGR
jgi:hypothetical protein